MKKFLKITTLFVFTNIFSAEHQSDQSTDTFFLKAKRDVLHMAAELHKGPKNASPSVEDLSPLQVDILTDPESCPFVSYIGRKLADCNINAALGKTTLNELNAAVNDRSLVGPFTINEKNEPVSYCYGTPVAAAAFHSPSWLRAILAKPGFDAKNFLEERIMDTGNTRGIRYLRTLTPSTCIKLLNECRDTHPHAHELIAILKAKFNL